MSANSVSPPRDGIVRPDSKEYLAVTGRNELSECQQTVGKLEEPDAILRRHDLRRRA